MKIVINADQYDFTPKGKRTARVVKTSKGTQLRWYVAGRLYRRNPPLDLTPLWLNPVGLISAPQ